MQAGDVAQVVEYLSSKLKALTSNPVLPPLPPTKDKLLFSGGECCIAMEKNNSFSFSCLLPNPYPGAGN
jgi:hypothetical protein